MRPPFVAVWIITTHTTSSSELEVKGDLWFAYGRGGAAHDQRGLAAQRGRVLGASVLRRAGVDRVEASWLWPPSLRPIGAEADRVHRLRPAHRADARRDWRGAREAASGSCSHETRLVAALEWMVVANRGADRGARAPEGRAHRVHRVRVPVAGPLQAGEPERPGGRLRPGTALLDRRPPGRSAGVARARIAVAAARPAAQRRLKLRNAFQEGFGLKS